MSSGNKDERKIDNLRPLSRALTESLALPLGALFL